MALKNKKVFITGISGFVGSHMAKYLLDEGANVFAESGGRWMGTRSGFC